MKNYKNISDYIDGAPLKTQEKLKLVRKIINDTVPEAVEEIAYGMPAYKWKDKPLFYFAAMKGHLGLYPTAGPIKTLQKELVDFSFSKGCIRIPYGAELPNKLIIKLLKARLSEIKNALKK